MHLSFCVLLQGEARHTPLLLNNKTRGFFIAKMHVVKTKKGGFLGYFYENIFFYVHMSPNSSQIHFFKTIKNTENAVSEPPSRVGGVATAPSPRPMSIRCPLMSIDVS